MERREAIKGLTGSLLGLVALPAWATAWHPTQLRAAQAATFLTENQSALLAEVVEAILPATDTKGAKEIGVHEFVARMVADCYDAATQAGFADGLTQLEARAKSLYGKAFAEISQPQRLNLLEGIQLSDSAKLRSFFSLLKNLTIQGYLNSEYVMTELIPYEMVPGRFHGCVPVKS